MGKNKLFRRAEVASSKEILREAGWAADGGQLLPTATLIHSFLKLQYSWNMSTVELIMKITAREAVYSVFPTRLASLRPLHVTGHSPSCQAFVWADCLLSLSPGIILYILLGSMMLVLLQTRALPTTQDKAGSLCLPRDKDAGSHNEFNSISCQIWIFPKPYQIT